MPHTHNQPKQHTSGEKTPTPQANSNYNKFKTKKATQNTNQKVCYSKPPHPRKESADKKRR